MASNAGVCMQKGVKSEKGDKKEECEDGKEGKRKANKDRTHLHPNTHSPVLSSRLNTHSHEVQVLGTLKA